MAKLKPAHVEDIRVYSDLFGFQHLAGPGTDYQPEKKKRYLTK